MFDLFAARCHANCNPANFCKVSILPTISSTRYAITKLGRHMQHWLHDIIPRAAGIQTADPFQFVFPKANVSRCLSMDHETKLTTEELLKLLFKEQT